MSKIDERELESAKYNFDELTTPRHPSPEAARAIKRKLSSMGLDLNADATYKLIQEGLTKKKFDDLELLAMTYAVTYYFHQAQDLSWQNYTDSNAASKHNCVERLIKTIERYLPEFEGRSLPADADRYHRKTFEGLLNDYHNGELQEYCDDLAVDHAVESYKNLQELWSKITADLKEGVNKRYNPFPRLEEIKEIKTLAAGMTKVREASFFNQAGVGQSGLDELHRAIALTVVREEIKTGCNSSNKLYQASLNELKAAGVDMNSEATYAALGMDKKTFDANCDAEANDPASVVRKRPAAGPGLQ